MGFYAYSHPMRGEGSKWMEAGCGDGGGVGMEVGWSGERRDGTRPNPILQSSIPPASHNMRVNSIPAPPYPTAHPRSPPSPPPPPPPPSHPAPPYPTAHPSSRPSPSPPLTPPTPTTPPRLTPPHTPAPAHPRPHPSPHPLLPSHHALPSSPPPDPYVETLTLRAVTNPVPSPPPARFFPN